MIDDSTQHLFGVHSIHSSFNRVFQANEPIHLMTQNVLKHVISTHDSSKNYSILILFTIQLGIVYKSADYGRYLLCMWIGHDGCIRVPTQ